MMYDLEAARAEAQRSASTDLLTGVLNRRRFIQIAEAILGRAGRAGSPVAVILLDIDNFKRINDQYGHRAGDEVLQAIGRLCSTTLRPEDQVARWGGEEFVALLPECSSQEAFAVAMRLRTAITSAIFTVYNGALQVSASIGVASTELGVDGLDHLLTLADRAMYEVKRNGKDSVMSATAVMSTEAVGQGDLFSR
jgi:diguanylate cyclase (GGDEF)-like protein